MSLRVNKDVLYVASIYFDLRSLFDSDTDTAPGLDQRPYIYRPLTWHAVCLAWLVAEENLSEDGLEYGGGFKKGSIIIVLLLLYWNARCSRKLSGGGFGFEGG